MLLLHVPAYIEQVHIHQVSTMFYIRLDIYMPDTYEIEEAPSIRGIVRYVYRQEPQQILKLL